MKKLLTFLFIVFVSVNYSFTTKEKLSTSYTTEDEKVTVVVIDPGHGGKDMGASFENVFEKDVVLSIAIKLGEKIKSVFPDVKLIYTRTNDRFIPVYERAEIANKNKADLFISIHVNSAEQSYVKGAETYVLGQHQTEDNLEVAKKENAVILLEDNYTTTYEDFDPKSSESYIMFELVQDEYLEQSIVFASAIQNQFKEAASRADRSVRQAGFIVLRRTTMPSVLIETGFLSNTEERKYLLSETGKNELANAIFVAFSDYKKKIEAKSQFSLIANDEKKITSAESLVNNIEENETKPEIVKDITYSIQLSATNKKVKPTAVNFKRIKGVFRKKYGTTYKYFIGSFKNYDEAISKIQDITNKFPDAIVVAFKNEELISVNMALEN